MASPEPTSLRFDDVVIDVAGHRLLRGGTEQPLEPKAFGVLALLAGSPGRVFARDEILDAVWGHRHITPGVLNRVMTLLRHALGEDAQGARCLHTVHGVGYRFDLPAAIEPAPELVPVEADASPMAAPPLMRRASDRKPKFPRIALWLTLLLAGLAFAGWRLWPRADPAPAATPAAPIAAVERGIAVLPLVNAGGDAAQQFFSDGISENLIDALSRVDGLKVIGRTSSFRFRDGKDDSTAIGAKLGVPYLVSGSVQRVDGQVRVAVELVSAADGHTVWTERYDRPYKDLFALQDEIAQAVAGALHARLASPPESARQSDRPRSGNIDAYNAFLRGLQRFYAQDFEGAVVHQQEATRLDPRYAAAWAQLAIAWGLIGQQERDRDKAQAAFRAARAAVDRALQLAPDLGIAHGALGNLLFASESRWREALAEMRRGAELAPDSGQIQGGLSRVLAANGKLEEAIRHRQRFLSIEPLAPFNYFLYADLLVAAGRLDEAEENLRIGQRLQGGETPPYRLSYIALLRGDAKAAMDIARRQRPDWRDADSMLAAQAGPDRAVADAMLARALRMRQGQAHPYLIAQAYALRGDPARTLEWLERAWAARDADIHQLFYDPLVLRFRDDPRFIAFCARIGLPPPSESEALDIDRIRATLAARR